MVLNGRDLHKSFPIPCSITTTSGIQDGIVLKFKTFYLKIYDIDHETGYKIEGYQYHKQLPIFQRNVKHSDFKKFASQFNKEDYLIRFNNQCE